MQDDFITKKTMQIKMKKPLFWFLITWFFPNAKWGDVALTFNTSIYSAERLPMHLVVHESVHIRQQGRKWITAVIWWIKYCLSRPFRFDQEIEAYGEQYRYIMQNENGTERTRLLAYVIDSLASPVYNSMMPRDEVKLRIEKYVSEKAESSPDWQTD